MGLCGNPDKNIKRKKRKRKTSFGSGRNAGHRYRGNPKMESREIDWIVLQPEDDIDIPAPGTLIEVSRKTHEMWDTHGYIQEWMNPCVQEWWECGDNPIPKIEDADGDLLLFGVVPSPRQLVRTTVPFLSSPQLDELALRSEDKLTDVVPTNVSLANFVIELIQACTGNVKGVEKFSGIYNKALKAYQAAYKRFLKQGHKEAAARWLAWNFAIKPTLGDLQAILCSMDALYKKLNWLRNHNNKVVYLHYSRDLTDQVSIDGNEWFWGETLVNILKADPNNQLPNGAYSMGVRYSGGYTLKYQAHSKVFLSIPDRFLEGMKGLSVLWGAMQGFHNPVGIIWEAIPFSWLIDYFLSYRARLWQWRYDYNPYDAGVEVLEYGHSFHCKCSGEAAIYNRPFDHKHYSYGGFEYELYSRQKGLPFPEQTTLFRLPADWYHVSIIGAIVIQSGKTRRR